MPKEAQRLGDAYESWNGDGLYFQHILIAYRTFVWFIVLLALTLAIVWSVKKDTSAGTGVGQFLLACIPAFAILLVDRLA